MYIVVVGSKGLCPHESLRGYRGAVYTERQFLNLILPAESGGSQPRSYSNHEKRQEKSNICNSPCALARRAEPVQKAYQRQVSKGEEEDRFFQRVTDFQSNGSLAAIYMQDNEIIAFESRDEVYRVFLSADMPTCKDLLLEFGRELDMVDGVRFRFHEPSEPLRARINDSTLGL